MPVGHSEDAVHASCVRRVALERRPLAEPLMEIEGAPGLWFVKVTVGGGRLEPDGVRQALEQLSVERAFLVCVRYDGDRAEVRYWDECDDAELAIYQALRLWGDREVLTRLQGWQVIGLEVVDRATARRQWHRGDHPQVFELGEILPFDD